MDQTELFRSSIRAIITNKTRSALTALGIIIGVASVILLVSIGSGLERYVTKQFESLGANLVFVAPGKIKLIRRRRRGPPTGFTSKFTFDDVRELERLGDPISGVSGILTKSGTAKYGSKSYDVTIMGIDEKYPNMSNIKPQKGQSITKSMVERSQNITMVGPKVVENLFPSGADPIGKQVDLAGRKYVIGGSDRI